MSSQDFPKFIFPAINANHPEDACHHCGCTDEDCTCCVEHSGDSCWWIAPNICSCCGYEGGVTGTIHAYSSFSPQGCPGNLPPYQNDT